MSSSLDFWICHPLSNESELGTFNRSHAFWSCANKMVNYLLDLDGLPEGHGIRPHSLKVTTISYLMADLAKGHANLSQLAIRGNYRHFAARYMANVYSRNIARRQIFVPNFAQSAFRGNTSIESIVAGRPVFSEWQ